MRGRVLAVSLFVALAAFGGLARAVERFALVVGNNRPDRPGQPLLQYADDDAARMYRLLV
ncbi:MAG: caspase family protein, partial [Deltaproteobacteria bacterium]